MKTEICLRILTPKNLNDHKDAIALLGLEVELMPEIVPEKFGSWEPLKNEFVVEKISEIVTECWAHEGFLWSRKKPFAVGSIQFQVGKACFHSGVKVDCALGAVPQCNLVKFLQKSSEYLNADLSILHLLNPEDMERGAKNRTVVPAANGECYFGITTHDLNKYIPDVYWAMIFGPAYVKLFGLEKLLSAPFYVVQQIGPEMVYMQLSKNVEDMRTNFSEVDKVRTKVKKHLGAAAFYRSGLLSNFRKTATFDIQPTVPRE